MKISIITPSYNQVKYLEQTILSVLNQNYPNLEYIIIDGGSTDGSVEIIKKYEKQLSYWESEKDTGQSNAINKGFKKATGEIVAWLNSDDLYFPYTLNMVAKSHSENPRIDLIYGDVENFYPNGSSNLFIHKPFDLIDFLSRVSIHQPAVFWKRKILDEIGYLDESLHYLMDYDLWMRIFLNYKTLHISQPLAQFRVHSDSKTVKNPFEMYMEYRKAFSRFINSINRADLKKKLVHMKIYDNDENRNYNIEYENINRKVEKYFNNYILHCGIQEYTFGSQKKANDLFLQSLKSSNFIKAIYYLMKNNLFKRKKYGN